MRHLIVPTIAWILVPAAFCAADRPDPISPHGLAKPSQFVVLSPAVDGVITDVRVAEGELVKQGQVVVVLDHRIAQASVELARATAVRSADIQYARHELRLAESFLRRVAAVRAEQAAAEFEYEEAVAKRDKAQASLDAALERQEEAKRQLALAEARLEQHFVRAPFDGRVVMSSATAGKMVVTQDELIAVADARRLRAELHLPIRWFGLLKAGDTCQLQAVEPLHRSIPATLTFASPLVDAGSRTFRCVFTIENQDDRLPAGFAVALVRPPNGSETKP